MPDCKPFSLLCTKNFLALAGAFLVTIAQGGAAYPGDCAECSVRRMSAVPGGVACPLCRRLTLPLVYFYAPYPPSPLPRRGRGCPKVYFAGGFAPGTPALDRSRHLQPFPNRPPTEWRLFATRVPAAPAGANAPFEAERTGFPQAMSVPRPIQPRGCKGRSPLHKKTKNLPLPRRGRGVGGWGQNQN